MHRIVRRMMTPHERGQALVFAALVITMLSMLILTCIEIAARYQERAQVEDALRQATRSAVQAFDYAAFARGGQQVRATGPATVTGCSTAAATSARALACTVLTANLTGVRGVQETPAQTAARVQWTILPNGGVCSFPSGRPPIAFTTPAVCATLTPQLRGLLGWGVWTPQIDAADTLDHIDIR